MEYPEPLQRGLILMADILISQKHEIKELRSLSNTLVDANKALVTIVTQIYKDLRETQVENNTLSDKVQKLAIVNEKLALRLKDQDEDSMTTKNIIVSTQNEISEEAFNQSSDSTKDHTGYNVSTDTESKISKRIVLHSDPDILQLVTRHSTEIQKLQTDVAALKTHNANGQSGSTYVRWGKNNCSGNGTELVYSGYAAGSDYRDTGAAANYICLTPDPLWGHYSDAQDAFAKVMGVEYEFYGAAPGDTTAFFHKNLHQEDAPCSVCHSPRTSVIMIPGRNQCYKGWTLEYKGYLVAGRSIHAAATEYVCLDDNPDIIPGGHANEDGALFYVVEGRCRSLLCPPYVEGRELTCVVCSK